MSVRRAITTASVLAIIALLPVSARAEFRRIDLAIVGMD